MRKNPFFLFGLSLTFFLVACGDKKNNNEDVTITDETHFFCATDSNTVLSMADEHMQHLKNKEYDAAYSEMYNIVDDSVSLITANEKQILINQRNLFPVLSYQVEDYSFADEKNVTVKYQVTFFDKPLDDQTPNTVGYTVGFQRLQGKWHMQLLNKN